MNDVCQNCQLDTYMYNPFASPKTAGHWNQVPKKAGYGKESEEINTHTVPAY